VGHLFRTPRAGQIRQETHHFTHSSYPCVKQIIDDDRYKYTRAMLLKGRSHPRKTPLEDCSLIPHAYIPSRAHAIPCLVNSPCLSSRVHPALCHQEKMPQIIPCFLSESQLQEIPFQIPHFIWFCQRSLHACFGHFLRRFIRHIGRYCENHGRSD
jgi:hypothetical protein